MKILIIEGSPHKKGSSNMLAESFAEGARGSGHDVVFFDAAHEDVGPCIACDRCFNEGHCVRNDAFGKLAGMIGDSDMVVFVTPLYFFTMTTQLKAVVDRLYSLIPNRTMSGKRAALLVAQNNEDAGICDGLIWNFERIFGYLGMECVGSLVAAGCGDPTRTAASGFMDKAREFGRSV